MLRIEIKSGSVASENVIELAAFNLCCYKVYSISSISFVGPDSPSTRSVPARLR
jgi:hypothetical protein